MHESPLSRYGLRLAALGYLAAIIVLPTSMILRKAFQNGVGPVMDALTDPRSCTRSSRWLLFSSPCPRTQSSVSSAQWRSFAET